MYIKSIPPLIKITGWEDVNIIPSEEPLCKAELISPKNIITCPMYYKLGIKGSLDTCLIRRNVAKKLLQASLDLPTGYRFIIWDAWRPLDVQKSIFENQQKIIKQANPQLTESEIIKETNRFVAFPVANPQKPSPHLTGASIDLSILNDRGEILYMGSEFDECSDISNTRYYEEKLESGEHLSIMEQTALENRRLLFHIMTKHGFTNYSEEWWHFDYHNQLWGKIKGKNAIYGLINM